jgi:hypothetical protein
MNKTISIPADVSTQVCLPSKFSKFLTFFGVVHPGGQNEIRWFVQHPSADVGNSQGHCMVIHLDYQLRYRYHVESMITTIADLKRRHVAILSAHDQKIIVIKDVAKLANVLAETEQARRYELCLFSALYDWVQRNYEFDDSMKLAAFVTTLQSILFPYYVRKRMVEVFGRDHSAVSIPEAFNIYHQGSYYPYLDDGQMFEEWDYVSLREFFVDR